MKCVNVSARAIIILLNGNFHHQHSKLKLAPSYLFMLKKASRDGFQDSGGSAPMPEKSGAQNSRAKNLWRALDKL